MPVADIDGDDFRETECKSYERAALYQMTKFELQDMLNASGCVHKSTSLNHINTVAACMLPREGSAHRRMFVFAIRLG